MRLSKSPPRLAPSRSPSPKGAQSTLQRPRGVGPIWVGASPREGRKFPADHQAVKTVLPSFSSEYSASILDLYRPSTM